MGGCLPFRCGGVGRRPEIGIGLCQDASVVELRHPGRLAPMLSTLPVSAGASRGCCPSDGEFSPFCPRALMGRCPESSGSSTASVAATASIPTLPGLGCLRWRRLVPSGLGSCDKGFWRVEGAGLGRAVRLQIRRPVRPPAVALQPFARSGERANARWLVSPVCPVPSRAAAATRLAGRLFRQAVSCRLAAARGPVRPGNEPGLPPWKGSLFAFPFTLAGVTRTFLGASTGGPGRCRPTGENAAASAIGGRHRNREIPRNCAPGLRPRQRRPDPTGTPRPLPDDRPDHGAARHRCPPPFRRARRPRCCPRSRNGRPRSRGRCGH